MRRAVSRRATGLDSRVRNLASTRVRAETASSSSSSSLVLIGVKLALSTTYVPECEISRHLSLASFSLNGSKCNLSTVLPFGSIVTDLCLTVEPVSFAF